MTLPAGWTSSPQLSCQTRSPASGCPAVVMVQPTHDRTSDHLVPCILRGRNRSALYRYLLPHALMRSCLVEVHHIGIEDALELPLMQDQYVVQAFLPDTPQEALTDRIGSGSMNRRFEHLNRTGGRHTSKARPKFAIVITDQIFRCLSIGGGFSKLLCHPGISWRACHALCWLLSISVLKRVLMLALPVLFLCYLSIR